MTRQAPITVAVVGAGSRGSTYGRLAAAEPGCRIVAVAEPHPERRGAFAAEHGLTTASTVDGWEELVARGRVADAVVVATQDTLHVEPAVAFLDQGYHVLLEKPMAPTEAGATRIAEAAAAARERVGGHLVFGVCHVLRYTAYTSALVEVTRTGRIGRPVSVQHLEPVGWWHHAHSYVRGNWRRAGGSGPMLLTKSCHDLDWLIHVLDQPVVRVSSFGGLAHFRPSERPEGATDRCLTCPIEPTCPYSAPRLYLGLVREGRRGWPVSVVSSDTSEDGLREALRTGPYGRCVYHCDNDVVDHQVVNLEFEDGATGVFTMTAFTPPGGRRTRLFGTHGSVEGDGRHLTVTDFRDGTSSTVDTAARGHEAASGHGGGDGGLIRAFLAAVAAGDPSMLATDEEESLAGHRVVWAAERARLAGTVETVTLPDR